MSVGQVIHAELPSGEELKLVLLFDVKIHIVWIKVVLPTNTITPLLIASYVSSYTDNKIAFTLLLFVIKGIAIYEVIS